MQAVPKFHSKLDSTMDVLEAFWQAALYNTSENVYSKVFMSIRFIYLFNLYLTLIYIYIHIYIFKKQYVYIAIKQYVYIAVHYIYMYANSCQLKIE